MEKKHKLLGVLGSAVLFGLSAGPSTVAHAGEGKCAGMNKGMKTEQSKEATCAGMKKEEKEKTKKQKEMTCGGPGGCGGKMKPKEGEKS